MKALIWLPLVLLAAEEPVKTSFSVLAGYEYTEGMTLPAEVTKLDEQTVTISGFMQRESPGSGPVEQFLLINDACGCTGTPKMNEIVFCAMPDGQTTDVKTGVFTVTGKIYVGEQKEDGVVVAVYSLDVDSIK